MMGLPFAMFNTKNGPAYTYFSATVSICLEVAESSMRAASLHQLSKTRSSMKHMTSAVTTGVLPVAANSQRK
ncbi:MAG: hypothetical protein BWY79_00548 [Actinobacteria bacterium ADurb.Bin444]|nr:MAG: hypothetical protein BWY79_00548 [Actinobacteria bacterium ADurb.Bin444]